MENKLSELTHWGRVTNVCVGNLTTFVSDNGLSPGRRRAIIWTNAWMLLIGPLGTKFSDMLIGIQSFSFKEMHLKMCEMSAILSQLQCVQKSMWLRNKVHQTYRGRSAAIVSTRNYTMLIMRCHWLQILVILRNQFWHRHGRTKWYISSWNVTWKYLS